MEKYKLSILCGAMLLTACGGGNSGNNNSTEVKPEPIPTPTCTSTQYLEGNICKDKVAQTITGLTLPNSINVDQTVSLSAQSSAGLALTYTSKTVDHCRITGDLGQQKVEMFSVGVCTIEANQAGNGKTLAALPVSASSTILPVLTTTGITLCGTNDKNNLVCNASNLGELLGLGQDGEIQAGKKMTYSLIKHNNDECIKDQITGLVWEQKTADAKLHDSNWRYSWFNANTQTNGGNAGSQASSTTCGSTLTSCNTTAYIEALNKANYCGYSDWRLPTRSELINLTDYSSTQPSLNPIFTNTTVVDRYWSSTTSAKQSTQAWMSDFKDGAASPAFKDYMGHIRAVRASQ